MGCKQQAAGVANIFVLHSLDVVGFGTSALPMPSAAGQSAGEGSTSSTVVAWTSYMQCTFPRQFPVKQEGAAGCFLPAHFDTAFGRPYFWFPRTNAYLVCLGRAVFASVAKR
jgi:hypothetical protein